MENIFNKISNYHIATYMIPGTLFCFLSDILFNSNFISDSFKTLIVIYFIGMIIDRIGSTIEPFLYNMVKIKKEPYANYIKAEQKDNKVELLLQSVNMYRSIISALSLILIIYIIHLTLNLFNIYISVKALILITVVISLLLTILSFRKSNSYLINRIQNVCNKKSITK